MLRCRNHCCGLCHALYPDSFELIIDQERRHGLQPKLKPDGFTRRALDIVHKKYDVVLGCNTLPQCLRLLACRTPRRNDELELDHGLSAADLIGKFMAHTEAG